MASIARTRLEETVVGSSSLDESYCRWIEQHDSIANADRAAIRAHVAALPFQPTISVIVVDAEAEASARATIRSIVEQLYPNWELCLARHGVHPHGLGDLLGAVGADPRIRTVRLDKEDRATGRNAALDVATGEFVTFVQTGDLLSQHALYEVAVQLGEAPLLDLVYTDEDCVDASGQRSEVRFKPGWDPDLILADNYIGSLAVYRRSLVEAVGSCRRGFDGAEDYDLVLRATAMTTPNRVRHLPAVLYHRRLVEIGPGREAMAAVEKLTAAAASRRAVREHLDDRGFMEARFEPAPLAPLCNRVVWPLPSPPPMVSIIVPTRDRAELLAQCAEGVLRRTDYGDLELLVVDNDSRELTTHALFERLQDDHPGRVRIVSHPGPFNFSALNNAAAKQARGEVLVLLNNDVHVIDPGWLREMVSHAVRRDVGAVGAKLLYIDERVQHAGVVLGPVGQMTHLLRLSRRNDPGYGNQLALARTLSAVTAACLAIRRSVFLEVGGLDEKNLHVAFNDIDLCLRLGDYGYRVIWTAGAELFHLESASRGPDEQQRFGREWQYMRRTWGSLLEDGDPFHNPNVLFQWSRTEIPSAPRSIKPWRRFAQCMWTAGEVR
jgi:O-antigen biosynthesis protein